jgi:phage-related protein
VDVGITIGKVLLPHLTEIVKAVGNWFDENNALIGQITEKLVEAIRILVLWLENHLFRWLKRIWGIIGDVAHQIHMWIVQLDSLSGSFDPVERALSAFTMGLNKILDWAESDKGTIALALGAIAFGIRALSAALMANPIVALLTAIVVAIGLLQQAWNLNVGGIQEKWADFVKWFETNALPRIQDALEWIEINVAPILEAAFKWFFEEAVPALMDGIKWLFEVGFPALGEAIADFYEQNREPLERLFTWLTDEAIPDVIEGLEGFGNWLITNGPTILSILGQLLEVLGGLFTIMLNIASYVIPILWEGLMTILAPLGIVGEAVGFLLFIIDESFKEIRRVVETVIGAVSEILTGLEGLIREIVAEIESRIDIVIGAWEELGRIWEDVWTGIQDWAETAGEIVEGIIDDIANAIYGVVRAVERAIDIIEDFLVAKGKYDTLAGKVPSPTAPKPSPTPTSSGTVSPTVSGTMIGGVQKFALGVRDFGGGLALVGERGPELVWLPPHASVYPNGEGPSTGLTVNLGGITVNAGNDVSPGAARKFAEMIHDELATTLQEQSARFPNKPRVGLT